MIGNTYTKSRTHIEHINDCVFVLSTPKDGVGSSASIFLHGEYAGRVDGVSYQDGQWHRHWSMIAEPLDVVVVDKYKKWFFSEIVKIDQANDVPFSCNVVDLYITGDDDDIETD